MEKKDSDSITCVGIEPDECEHLFAVINISSEQPPAEWPECCIYRVPKKLRKIKEEAYTPKLISIGPFHHGGNEFKDMEKHKVRYFKDFLKRTEKSVEDLLEIIKVDKEKISHCYSEDCVVQSDDHFVKIILLDAIFIIELFLKVKDSKKRDEEEKAHGKGEVEEEDEEEAKRKRKKGEKEEEEEEGKKAEQEDEEEAKTKRKKGVEEEEEEDYILRKPWLLSGIGYDLILLENQVPFFILEKLYILALNDSPSCNHGEEEGKQTMTQDAPFVMLSRNFFAPYDKHKASIIDKEVNHFTDLLRYFFCSVPSLIMKPHQGLDNRICATKLEDAGLKFKVVKNDRRLLEITLVMNWCLTNFPCFNLSWLLACLPCLKNRFLERMQPILEVPLIEIEDNTEVIFRNLIALEQCHYPFQPYMCNYAMLLDNLIDSEKDVDLLVEKQIIHNNIGSNQAVAELINRLCLEIVVLQSCYSGIGEKINTYSHNPWNHIMAGMKSKFFSDFWRGTATIFAIFFTLNQLWRLLRPFVINK